MIRVLLVIVLALVTALGWALWRAESHKGDAAAAEVATAAEKERADGLAAELAGVKDVLKTERESTAKVQQIATKTQQELTDAQDRADRLADDLATGKRRVRLEIAALHTAHLSAESAATRELEAAAQRGSAYLASAVRVGRECDIVQRGLIEAYESLPANQENAKQP